jgi:selenocysteine lyase/cysteine desulfurase
MELWASDPSQAFFNNPELNSFQSVNRTRMAAFVKAPATDVVLTDNTTMGLAMVLLGLPFRPGDEILVTNHDHFSMLSPLYVLQSTRGVNVVTLSLPNPATSAEQIVDIFRRAITPQTRVICFSHVTYTVGLRMPVGELCTLARQYGILSVVDAAHAMGMLDLDIPALGCDFYATSGHKWFNGPPGTGILYIRNAVANPYALVPIVSERAGDVGNGVTIADALQKRANLNGPAFAALSGTADFADWIGTKTIEDRILHLASEVRCRAVDRWGTGCLYSPPMQPGSEELCSGLTAFLPSKDSSKSYDTTWVQNIATTLWSDYRIWTLSTAFPAPAGVPAANAQVLRISTSIYNDEAQIDRLFAALDTIVASRRMRGLSGHPKGDRQP